MPKQPPVTPSPYRFLPIQKGKSGPTQVPKPAPKPPAAWSEVTNDVSRPQQQQQWTSASSQFAATPRFSIGRPPTNFASQRSLSPQKPSLPQALQHSKHLTEDVEDSSQQDEDDEMLDLDYDDAIPTTERGNNYDDTTVPFSPKRRRLDDATTNKHIQKSAFKRPHPETNQPYSRPAFIRPSPGPPEPSTPLPETFSPHKRGQKFVPGGLAATLQQWVVETGEAAVQSRRGQGYLLGEEWISRVRVEEMKGGGPFAVRGGEGVRMLLAGGEGIGEGNMVGVRAPVWEVEVDGSQWIVAVDWKVLS